MCVSCEKLLEGFSLLEKQNCCDYKLVGSPRHYGDMYPKMISVEVGICTYWTVDKLAKFETWLKESGFRINSKRTRWVDFCTVVLMIRFTTTEDEDFLFKVKEF